MSFLAKRPNLPQTTNSAQANQIPSFQGAVPMTLAYGRVPYQGARWLCDAFDRHTQRAGSNKPDWQYASIAASFGSGCAAFVGKVRINGTELANLDHVRGGGEDYIDYTFNPSLASGEASWMRFYFGTETQTADAYLRAGTGQTHPAYRGQPYAVFHNLDLGAGTTAIPQIEIEVGFATPTVGTYPAPAGAGAHPYGVNVFAAIYGLFTTPYGGLAADAGLLDATHWGNQAAALEATGIARRTGDLTKLHAVVASITDAASVVSEWLTYVDGYIYARGGQLRVGWFPHASFDPSSLPQVTEHDLTTRPSGGGFPDANAGLTDTVVTYLDFDRQYTQQGAKYRAPANRRTQVVGSPQQIDRPLCHAHDQAALLAAEASTSGTQQDTGTTLTVLRSRAVNLDGSPLLPGDLFNFDYDPESLDLVCRVTERIETDPAAPVQLTVVRDRGAFPTPHTPALDARVLPTEDAPGEVTAPDVRLWMLPGGFGATRQVTALIDRPTRSDVGALLSLSPSGSAPWQQIADQRYFPAKCAVTNGGITSGAATVRVTSTSVDFARMQAQNAVAQKDDTLLLLIEDELVSVSTIAVVTTNTYDLGILRARQSTTAAAHANGVVAWLFYRAEIDAIENEEFYNVRSGGVYNSGVATKHFKIALFTVDQVGNAKPDDPGLSLVLPDIAPTTPTGLAAAVGTGKAITLSWNANPETNISGYDIYRNTVNTFSTATLIAFITATRFVDINVAIGTTEYYWLSARNPDGESAPTASVNATPTTVATGSLDHTVPSDPTAATQTGSGTYQSTSDGATLAYEQFSVPAMPAGAAGQNFLFKNHADSQWVVVGQYTNNTTMTGLRVRGLTPGQQYDFATEAYNAFGDFSNVIATTGNPFTAPGDTTAPGYPTSVQLWAGDDTTIVRPPPKLWGATGQLSYALVIKINGPADKDIAFFDLVQSTIDTDAAADLIYGFNGPELRIPAGGDVSYFYRGSNGTQFLRIKPYDHSFNAPGGWYRVGDISSYLKLPAGDLTEQNKNNVQISAVKTGDTSASSVRQVRTVYDHVHISTLAGGAPTETSDCDLSNRGFLAAPDAGVCAPIYGNMAAYYDPGNGANSSTNARLLVYTLDGTNLPAGAHAINVHLVEYT